MAKATALDKVRRVRQRPKPKSQSAQIGPNGPKHPGNRQLYDKRGRPDAGARLYADYPNPKVATFCAALWSNFTLPLTVSTRQSVSRYAAAFGDRLYNPILGQDFADHKFCAKGIVFDLRLVVGQKGFCNVFDRCWSTHLEQGFDHNRLIDMRHSHPIKNEVFKINIRLCKGHECRLSLDCDQI
jgi:hypothetical protein